MPPQNTSTGSSSTNPSTQFPAMFSGQGFVFFIIVALLGIFAYFDFGYSDYIRYIFLIALFIILIYKPRIVHFIELQMFGSPQAQKHKLIVGFKILLAAIFTYFTFSGEMDIAVLIIILLTTLQMKFIKFNRLDRELLDVFDQRPENPADRY